MENKQKQLGDSTEASASNHPNADWYLLQFKGELIDEGEAKNAEFCIRARKLGAGAVVVAVKHPVTGRAPFGFHYSV
jgi:hypothetical protein